LCGKLGFFTCYFVAYLEQSNQMDRYSTRQAAKKLGLGVTTLARYIEQGKVPAPAVVHLGGFQVHLWTPAEIEHVRQLLPKIANGRKTRYKEQSAKTKAPARVPVPHKKQKPKKK
jgi:predicted DNA-binding transcriptional regulator AlpA